MRQNKKYLGLTYPQIIMLAMWGLGFSLSMTVLTKWKMIIAYIPWLISFIFVLKNDD